MGYPGQRQSFWQRIGRAGRNAADALSVLVADALRHPERPLDRLEHLPAAERHQVLREWNDPTPFPDGFPDRAGTVHGRFADGVRDWPDRVAVVAGREWLTFGDLDRRTAALAGRLCAAGVAPEVPVGLCLERSADLIVGLLGIVRAGGAYVPLDPALPRERLQRMLDDSGAPIVVTRRGLLPEPPSDGRCPSAGRRWSPRTWSTFCSPRARPAGPVGWRWSTDSS